MISWMKATLGAAAIVVATGPVAASPISDIYSSLWFFGDSLTDPGNVSEASGGLAPGPNYFDGRFSSGPVWAEYLDDGFDPLDAAAFDPGNTANFAFGGAWASDRTQVPFDIPDLSDQIGLFDLASPLASLGARPLAAVWAGANDILGSFNDAAAQIAAGDPVTVDFIGNTVSAAQSVAASVAALAARGINDFLVLNLPDLGSTPRFALLSPANAAQATDLTNLFNATLQAELALLQAEGLDITLFDVNSVFASLIADPASFGVLDATAPCIIPDANPLAPPLAGPCPVPDLLAFYDPVHPSGTIHQQLAGQIEAVLVPLPAGILLLTAALVGLGLVRRRV